jgi:hypothetical protein
MVDLMRQNLNKPDFNQETPYSYAKAEYERRGIDFEEAVLNMHRNGWVVSVPYLFSMGYFYAEEGKVVCHVTYLAGEIGHLMRFCINNYLDYIEFERNFSGKVKRYDFKEFMGKLKNG